MRWKKWCKGSKDETMVAACIFVRYDSFIAYRPSQALCSIALLRNNLITAISSLLISIFPPLPT